MTDQDKLEEIEKALNKDADRNEALESDLDRAERKHNPPPPKPDHASDGGVF